MAATAPTTLPLSGLEQVGLLLGLDDVAPGPLTDAQAAARRRAAAVAATIDDADAARRFGALAFASESLASTWLDRGWDVSTIDMLVEGVSRLFGAPPDWVRASLFTQAVRERHILELPPHLGAETVLEMVCAFTTASAASFWALTPAGPLVELASTGDGGGSSRRARAAAREAVEAGGPVTSGRSLLHAVPVGRWGEPAAALVVRCGNRGRSRALAFASEAAAALAPVVEFDALLGRNAGREQSLTEMGERRLARVGFDLHDGPMQDIAALAADLRLFRQQAQALLAGVDNGEKALGRVDDLEARLVSLDRELRELASSLQSPAGLRVPLVDAIRGEVEAFEQRAGISTRFETIGGFDALTSSQKIALVRVVHEALSNVQEHSGASAATVQVKVTRARLEVEITDDGGGFDVEQQLLLAARAGRLGLVGMGERIRLLGGSFDLHSRPGGPTRVRARIPRWQPPARQA